MVTATRSATRLVDLDDVLALLTALADGHALVYEHVAGRFVLRAVATQASQDAEVGQLRAAISAISRRLTDVEVETHKLALGSLVEMDDQGEDDFATVHWITG